jgi:hypothetical protein
MRVRESTTLNRSANRYMMAVTAPPLAPAPPQSDPSASRGPRPTPARTRAHPRRPAPWRDCSHSQRAPQAVPACQARRAAPQPRQTCAWPSHRASSRAAASPSRQNTSRRESCDHLYQPHTAQDHDLGGRLRGWFGGDHRGQRWPGWRYVERAVVRDRAALHAGRPALALVGRFGGATPLQDLIIWPATATNVAVTGQRRVREGHRVPSG